MHVEIDLTPKQKQILRPLFDEVDRAAKASQSRDTDLRGAVLGQVLGDDENVLIAYWLNHAQFLIVARALKRALKLNGNKASTNKRG